MGGAIDDRAPSFFGILLICIGLLAAYGLVTGTLQNAWAALTGSLTPASSSATSQPASTPGEVGTSSVGSYASTPVATPALGSSATFASDYSAPNISQPQVVAAAVPIASSSAQVPLSGQPSISTPQNIYGALAA